MRPLACILTVLIPIVLCSDSGTDSPAPDAAARQACTSLVTSLGSSIVQSRGDEYQAAASGAWNLFNAQSTPTCIVFPRIASHVQTAMRAIYAAGAHYAVQAGGHSAMKDWNTVEDGVLIDFTHMKAISYNAARDTITIQPGARWGEAVSALQSQGVAPVGGRLGDIGTGYLLGGGLSYLSPAYGFGADSYKEVDVVLVSGNLVTATVNNQYSDLFLALKGGANRFGIVTRYELYAVHTGTANDKNWFGGSIIYPESSFTALLKATAHYVHNVKEPKAAILITLAKLNQGGVVTPLAAAYLFFNGPSLPTSIYGEFLSIPAISQTLGPLSYVGVTEALGSGNNSGTGEHFGASALSGIENLYLDAYDHWSNFTDTFISSTSLNVLAFTPVLDPQIQAGRARGGNAMNPPDGGYAAVQMQTTFLPGITAISADFQQGFQLLVRQVPRSPGLPLFINECDADQNVFETYGSFERIKQTYAKYDPTRFNVRHTTGPRGL